MDGDLKRDWRRMLLGHPVYWCCQLVGWYGSASGEIIVSSLHLQRTPLEIAFTLFGATLGIILTHGLRLLIWWQDWFRWSSRKQLVASILICMPAAALHTSLFLSLAWAFDPYRVNPTGPLAVASTTLFWTYSASLVWCGFYFGWHYLQNYQQAAVERARLDTALREAELRALRAQINPHFLFNALNSVRALVETDPGRARDAVTILANLLRASLSASEHQTVPLARELEAVQDYLALERIRFEDRLCVSFDIQPEACAVRVPLLSLQTLIENAVKHGISPSVSGGRIEVSAQKIGSHLHVRVENTPGQLKRRSGAGGTGLRNLAERLRLLFGSEAGLRLVQNGNESVLAELRIPAQESSERRDTALSVSVQP